MTYPIYAGGTDRPQKVKEIIIKGAANVINPKTLFTPDGAVTEVSDADLELLKKGIQFKTGSSKLTKASYKILDDIVKLLKKVESAKLEVQGHTDNTGSEQTNKKISQERADMVANYFIKKGIAADRVRAVGYGSEMPIADNNSKKNRAKNRRVELVPFE